MRCSLALAMVAVIAPAVVLAQRSASIAPAGPRIGILAGLSSATFGGRDASFTDGNGGGKKRRNGLVAGVYTTAPLGVAGLSLWPELLYAQKGVRITSSYAVNLPTTAPGGAPEIISVAATTKLDYLELPVLLQLDVPTATGVHPAVYLGPSVAYRVRCRTDLTISGQHESTACDAQGEDTRKYDVSGVVVGQLGFVFAGQSLGVGLRYTHGLTNLSKELDIKNRELSVYGSIGFPLRR